MVKDGKKNQKKKGVKGQQPKKVECDTMLVKAGSGTG
jgi:hypothetical protein